MSAPPPPPSPPPGSGNEPPPGYSPAPPAYSPPPPAYGTPPPAYGTPPPAYGTPPPAYGSPQFGGAPYGASGPVDASKKVPAGVLGILLGALGIHKFILGYTKEALIMLLTTVFTCGIAGIVWGVIGIIEGIIYLTKSDQDSTTPTWWVTRDGFRAPGLRPAGRVAGAHRSRAVAQLG
jgi:TM2 domain-containing membrane protein YozV